MHAWWGRVNLTRSRREFKNSWITYWLAQPILELHRHASFNLICDSLLRTPTMLSHFDIFSARTYRLTIINRLESGFSSRLPRMGVFFSGIKPELMLVTVVFYETTEAPYILQLQEVGL